MYKTMENDANVDQAEDFLYRNFIYLNFYVLESFTAQKNKGLPRSFRIETTNEKSEDKIGKQETAEPTIEGKIDTKLKILSPSLRGKVSAKYVGDREDESYIESKKSVMTKVLRDDMYKEFSDYIKKSDTFCTCENVTVEKYIEISDQFHYIDFERLRNWYNSEYIQKSEKAMIVKKQIEEISGLIPFNTLLCSQEFIVLIDNDGLQYKQEHIGYSFEGTVRVFGRVGKQIGTKACNPNATLINMLNESQSHALSLLQELCGFSPDKNPYIITPIAIYY